MFRKSLIRCAIVSLLICLSFSAGAEQLKSGKWDGLKQMMSAEEFTAAGLDNLSAKELHELDHWILNILAYDSQQLVKSDKKIQKLQKVAVRRRIIGHFRGWSGKTVFRLDNGEIWQQRLTSRYAVSIDNPEVDIAKNLFGFYEMKIVKTGRKVGVSRVK